MAKPFDGGIDATEARLMELGRKRLDPLLADRREGNEANLLARGIRPGSQAYDRSQLNTAQGENDAYNQLMLTGNQQAFQQGQALRNQPINEITALLSGSQVSQPQVNTNMPTIPTTDVAGLIGQDYQNQLAQSQQQQAMLGNLFSAGATLISDRRAKTNIKRVGQTDDGTPIYTYKYRTGGPTLMGVMADELGARHPEAVSVLPGGFLAVNYDLVMGNS